jgi:protein phosphatase PTC7
MIPARLVTAYSSVAAHRLAHWMMSRPFAMATMQRYLSIAPQYLLTPSSSHGIPAPTLVALDGSATNSSASTTTQSSCQLHTSTTATATAAALLQQQPQPLLAHDILLPADLFGTSTLASLPSTSDTASTSSEVIQQTVATSTTAPASHNAIAYNYLLAASWHPKSRQRQQQQVQQVQKAQADAEAANTARTLLWKEKLKAAHPGKVDAGEDAFFHVSTRSRVALGVADGVGGWSEVSSILPTHIHSYSYSFNLAPPPHPSAHPLVRRCVSLVSSFACQVESGSIVFPFYMWTMRFGSTGVPKNGVPDNEALLFLSPHTQSIVC